MDDIEKGERENQTLLKIPADSICWTPESVDSFRGVGKEVFKSFVLHRGEEEGGKGLRDKREGIALF